MHIELWRFMRGSSPRMRGTLDSPSAIRCVDPVHPRACGEHAVHAMLCAIASRFIPAHAGNTQCKSLRLTPVRFIPAHAGNTRLQPMSRGDRHTGSSPRMRGTRRELAIRMSMNGSSPRMRGTRRTRPRSQVAHRPVHPRACGEHADAPRRPIAQSVHPRACGEHVVYLVCGLAFPRFIPARAGNTHPQHGPELQNRFIPARAGNTRAGRSRHPLTRFIPARAGNTAGLRSKLSTYPVHPRVRGTLHPRILPPDYNGSSPRVRGTPPGRRP